jgi:hypothetical protein
LFIVEEAKELRFLPPMKIETLCQRLREGKSVNYLYEAEGNQGLVSAWRYENIFVLAWEECTDGDQYDEDNYT